MKTIVKNKQSGEILIFVIFIVLFLMLFVGLFISRILVRQSKTADNVASSVQAFYMADTGSEFALSAFQNCNSDSNPLPECVTDSNRSGKASAGTFVSGGDFTIAFDASNSHMDITGSYNSQTSRAIELSWVAN